MYYIEIPKDEPLAKAIIENAKAGEELWLVLKRPCEASYFRANISQWSIHNDGKLGIDFESWEQYMERKARLAGI